MTNLYFLALALGGLTLVATVGLGKGSEAGSRRRGPLRDPRFWSFAFTFFGLTGLVLGALAISDDPHLVLGLSAAVGVVTGVLAHVILGGLARGETSTAADERDFVGKTGRVLHPFGAGDLGKVRLTIKGTTVDVLARTDEADPFAAGEAALIIHMHDTIAAVLRPTPSDD
ncbi:MAG: hypothetical protein R3B09_16800 [Nannocystaceae bacterium]